MVLCPNSGKRGSALRYPQFRGTEEGRRQAVFWKVPVRVSEERRLRRFGGERGDSGRERR